MSCILVRVENKPIFFFNNLKLAIEETLFYHDFAVYQFEQKEQYVIGESNALIVPRPHFYDWNGIICPHSRLDGNSVDLWRTAFKSKLEKVFEIKKETISNIVLTT